MIARIQRLGVFLLLLAAMAWCAHFWSRSPLVAIVGGVGILMGYTMVLLAQFAMLCFAGQTDPGPKPSWRELFGAWVGEVLQAARVFGWRQPFRVNAEPDFLDTASRLQGRRGAVFVHGFSCNRGFWNPWLEQLRAQGHAFVAVDLEPAFGSIDAYCQVIDAAVRKVGAATGLAPVIVSHSMGGLAVRAWLARADAGASVHHVITIGTPHRGTWLARFGYSHNTRQMRIGSDWLERLGEKSNAGAAVGLTCWYSNCDNIVFPVSTATLPGASNRLIRGVAHVDLAFQPQVMSASLAQITAV